MNEEKEDMVGKCSVTISRFPREYLEILRGKIRCIAAVLGVSRLTDRAADVRLAAVEALGALRPDGSRAAAIAAPPLAHLDRFFENRKTMIKKHQT